MSLKAPRSPPCLKRNASKDKFRRKEDNSEMVQIVNIHKAAAVRSSPSALGGGCGDVAAPPTSAFSSALEAGPVEAPS